MSYRFDSPEAKRRNIEACVRGTIEGHRDKMGLRPHEIERAVKIGADIAEKNRSLNWGQIADAATTAITSGH